MYITHTITTYLYGFKISQKRSKIFNVIMSITNIKLIVLLFCIEDENTVYTGVAGYQIRCLEIQ